jgi:acetolactate synthase small subunit
MHQNSNLKLYSLGIVVEDKLVNSDYIVVSPMEQLSTIDGKLSDTSKIKTQKGQKVIKRNTILAKWIQNGQTNRATSPNVYKNETVRLYRYADTDKYYWDTVFFEPKIRRLEEVTYSYSNLKEPLVEYGPNTSYYYTVSTLNQFIHLHTSTNNGEASGYDILINTKSGEISIKDTNGNQLLWKSVAKHLDISNFNQYNINILDSITTKVGNTTITNIGQTKNLNVPTININSSNSININCPTVSINGNLNVSGTINASTVNAPNGSVGN